MHRQAMVALGLVTLVACNDVRDFRGNWSGPRVGDTPALRLGIRGDATAQLAITSVDRLGLAGTITVTDVATDATIAPLPGAEADRVASLTFDGGPLRVYLSSVTATDGGDAPLAMIALYDDDRVEVRLIRGGARPMYAIFDLRR